MNEASPNTNLNSVLHVHQDENTFEFSHEENNIFNFSPHHLLNHDQHEFLFSSISLPYQTPTPPPPSPPPPPLEKGKRKAAMAEPKGSSSSRRAAGKKDRHSKIYTAQGPRDRRMRLSLQIARKFFDLQDMLGFDKASKTIDWLFNKSKAAIKDLADKSCTTPLANTPSSPSEDHCGNNPMLREAKVKKQISESKGVGRTKESRAKAREWARKRTKEKLMMKKGGKSNNNNSKEVLEVEQNPSRLIIRVNNNDDNNNDQIMEPLEDQMASVGIIEKLLAASSSSSALSHFHHDGEHQRRGFAGDQQMRSYNSGGGVCYEGFPGNWTTTENNNARLLGNNNVGDYGGLVSYYYNQGI